MNALKLCISPASRPPQGGGGGKMRGVLVLNVLLVAPRKGRVG